MKRARLAVAFGTLLSACAGPPASTRIAPPPVAEHPAPIASMDAGAQATAVVAPERLTADSPRETVGGTPFTAPAGWTITTKGTVTILEPPEGDSHVALVTVTGADAPAALAAAWSAYHPAPTRPLEKVVQLPARNGWEQLTSFRYQTSPSERATVYATTRRHGDSWTVMTVEAFLPTFNKRYEQVLLVRDSLKPKGYVPESFAGKKANPLDVTRIKAMGDFVETARKELAIPGVALALIDGGKVVFEGGFGVRELGKPAPIDAETNFIIASNTKGMTTLLLAKLVDEGRFTWDTPVAQLMPTFKLGDADLTSRVLVKHLVCMCTGLPHQDVEWKFEFKQATPRSAMDVLATMQPTSPFGTFQYCNPLAAAGGYFAGHVVYPNKELGSAYDEAMRTKIFEPLGMKGTTFDIARAERGDHARPHQADLDGVQHVAKMDMNHSIASVRPTGGAWSSVHDVAKYLQMELAKGGLPDGKRLVSEANVLARRVPQARVGPNSTYGMGLMVDRAWDVPVVWHNGSLFGYKSELLFLPEHGVGAVWLANSDDAARLQEPFKRRLLEVLFDGKPEALEDLGVVAGQLSDYRRWLRTQIVVPADPAAVAGLAAHYTSATLGELTVRKAGAATVFDAGEWSSAVATRKEVDGTTTFLLIDHGSDIDFEFTAGERNGKRVLIVRERGEKREYVFTEG
jgi:CubicO group peptidase (beta-lactamase class C family)